jgi:rubrerythrin
MDDASKTLISEGLLKAIQAEQDGHHFYLMAAQNTQDRQGKEVFEKMAQEELDHNRFLRHQYEHIQATGQADPEYKLEHKVDLAGESPIFSPVLKARIKQAHFEMSAVSIAIQLELSAMSFYKEQAGSSSDTAVKHFFQELASWEATHYHALLCQQDSLKGDYWNDGGFSPF